jgi:tripartite-type tricarboxylate transporter receptor subunit TctC
MVRGTHPDAQKAGHLVNVGSIDCPGRIRTGQRRKFKGAVVLLRTAGMLIAFAIGAASVVPAGAQVPYPNRPIRIVVPFGPGGFADITVRLLGQKLAERTSAQVVIEKSLLRSMPFDPVTAFAPISTMALFDLLLLVKADSPMHTLKDALDAARADPQKFNVGTINPGSTQNVTGELLRASAGIAMTIVPHRTSAEVLTSLLRGDTQIGIESYAALKSPIDARQIRAVASSGNKRSPQLPEVPTLRESGIDAAVDGWNSLVAPAGTPRDIVTLLNGHVRAIIGDPDFQKRMIELGGEPFAGSPEELDARLRSDIDMWAAVVKKAGLEPN